MRILALALATGAVAGVGFADAAVADDVPLVAPVPACFAVREGVAMRGRRLDCGHVVVPEDPARPDGATVRLAFMRVRGGGRAHLPPLFMIAGGLGSSLIRPDVFYMFDDGFLGPLLAERDIVILDQRGAGHSIPHLDCPEVEAFGWTAVEQRLDRSAAQDLTRQAVPVCARRARASGIDLARFNVLAIVADIDAARAVLGYDRIALYGASYGAQISQQMMRAHPEALEAVILDGANALSAKSWVQDRVRDTDDALNRLHELCEADESCAQAYDIRALVDAGMALFDEGPITAQIADPADPAKALGFEITATDFASLVFGLQTGQTGVRAMPSFLTELLAEGRNSAAAVLGPIAAQSLLAARNPGPQEIAALAHAAIVCSDDPVTQPADLAVPPLASRYARVFGQGVYAQYRDLCAAVAVPVLPPSSDMDAVVDVPTLILSGALDARTPTFRSREVASTLSRVTLAVFPEGTHVQLGEVNFCAASIVVGFLGNPDQPPSLACIADMPRRGFVLPDGTNSAEVPQ